jgi:Tol biopolymer transport system component
VLAGLETLRREPIMVRPGAFRPVASITAALAPLVVIVALVLASCGGSSTTAATSPSAMTLPVAEASQSATPLPTPTVAGTIVFENVVEPGHGGNGDIYVVNADGTGLRPLAQAPGWEDHPSSSPDGRMMVYDVIKEGSDAVRDGTVWVMNADGSGKRQLAKGSVRGAWATWSPDGKQIAFMRALLPERFAIFVMNADGSGLKRATREVKAALGVPADEFFPAWAPNGRILFLRLGDVFAVNPDGSALARLTKNGNIGEFALSPDGKRIAIQDIMKNRLVVIPAHGGGTPVTLLDNVSDLIPDEHYAALTWTPDGQALAVASSSYDGYHGSRLYIVNADGSELSAVPGIDNAEDPSWRPQ